MSSLPELQFHKDAFEEVQAAHLWYRERDRRIARFFREELERAIENIRRSPKRWPIYGSSLHRYLLHGFPFQVIYYLDTHGTVVVLAVAHTRKRPGYWVHRK
jgi:hypothetical protein